MASLSKIKQLGVWMNGHLIGHWTIGIQGRHEFKYTDSWLDSKEARPLSLSMPLRSSQTSHIGKFVEYYFENLLPDSDDIRRRIQAKFSSDSSRAFDLLTDIGKDCVGAIQLLPPGEEPESLNTITGSPITPLGIAKALDSSLNTPRLGLHEDAFRISLAGAQEKTAFLRHKGKWVVPSGTTPTTHIFKLPLGLVGNSQADMSTSVENEWLCSRIVKAFQIPVAQCNISTFGERKVLVVKRFDRKLSKDNTWWMRLPQEDMCQALGYSPLVKYQNQGGPGILDIMQLLYGSLHSEADRETFFKTQILFWMLAAPDGHAKNFSLFIKNGGKYQLTPLYDIISAYPIMGKTKQKIAPEKIKMAMYVKGKNKHDKWLQIHIDHWFHTAKLCGLSKKRLEVILEELIETTPQVIQKVSAKLPRNFPEFVASSIFTGLKKAAKTLSQQIT